MEADDYNATSSELFRYQRSWERLAMNNRACRNRLTGSVARFELINTLVRLHHRLLFLSTLSTCGAV